MIRKVGSFASQVVRGLFLNVSFILFYLHFRQNNILETSSVRFPNLEFIEKPEFTRIVLKLYWSCHPNVTRFGYKRRRMEENFPDLCPYYDQYFYGNAVLVGKMEQGN